MRVWAGSYFICFFGGGAWALSLGQYLGVLSHFFGCDLGFTGRKGVNGSWRPGF